MSMGKSDQGKSSPICLQLVSPAGPSLSNHAGCLLGDTLYIHGGVNKYMSKQPLRAFYSLNLGTESPIWTEIRAPDSPSLSHHRCFVLEERYIVLLGGWNGKVRTTEAFAYDTQESVWIPLTTSGFAEGGGLSSHRALVLDDGTILVVGREGSARLQRRYGNAWILRGSIKSRHFTYTEHDIRLSSRSGHTMHTLGNTLVIVGGRTDNHIELHNGYRSPTVSNALFKDLNEFVKRSSPMVKPPCGRKQHVSASGSGLILIHGGETFDGKSREPVGEFYLVVLKPQVVWYQLGVSGVGRAGHVCCTSADRIIIHGGLGSKYIVHSDTYQIKLSDT